MAFVQGQLGGAGSGGEVEFTLRIDTTQTQQDLNKLITTIEIIERTLQTVLRGLQRFTGDENINNAINRINVFISTLNQMWLALSLAMANPYFLPIAALSIFVGLVSTVDSYQL